jgi:hypothetical protein
MADIREQPKFRIQDNPSIVETYANKFLGSVFDGGAVSLTFGTIRVVVEKTGGGQPAQGQETVIQVTHRLTLAPAAAVELMKGLNTTMTTLKANVQRKMQQGGQSAAFSLPAWEEIRAEPEFSQRK